MRLRSRLRSTAPGRLLGRVTSLVGADSTEGVEGVGRTVLLRGVAGCDGTDLRWKTGRSRTVEPTVGLVRSTEGLVGEAERVVTRSISCLPIRLPRLLARSGLSVRDRRDVKSCVWRLTEPSTRGELSRRGAVGVIGELGRTDGDDGDDRQEVAGARTVERVNGFGEGETGVVGPEGIDGLGLLNDGCLWIVESGRDGAENDRLGTEGVDGAGRLMLGGVLGAGVRLEEMLPRVPRELFLLIWIFGCDGRLIRGLIDRLGVLVEGRDMKPRLLCEGSVRCGVGREIDGVGRLGAGRAAWRLLDERPLSLEPRVARWAWATEPNNRAAATTASTATKLDFSFFENIIDLLSPGDCPPQRRPLRHRRRSLARVPRSHDSCHCNAQG
ncbi:MAG: hypothetical protein JW741_08500 [Sedimentisphaerales bacterium]|nr:hypothetical protein [Sedimentisphaerales bacterium]